MKIGQHTLVGALLSVPVSNWSIPGAMIFFISSVILDVDHFIFYLFHEKVLIISVPKFLSFYRRWEYYGPRIHIFHNYEWALLLAVCVSVCGGMFLYLLLGVVLHLICDQLDSYRSFRYMRIRSLICDVIHYERYLQARRKGREKEYMIERRDSWWNHLRNSLPKEHFKDVELECGILDIYPEIPIDRSSDSGRWKRLL